MYSNILITTDGSDLARKGIVEGLKLAKALGAVPTILTVTEPLKPSVVRAALEAGLDDPLARYEHEVDADMQERLQRFLESHEDVAANVVLRHEIDDHPAEAIVRTAEIGGHDLIVMASHGHRGLRKMLLGSQTAEVLVHTKIPVLVVR
jgi:nucleotide-binding universal stress UspA family protein